MVSWHEVFNHYTLNLVPRGTFVTIYDTVWSNNVLNTIMSDLTVVRSLRMYLTEFVLSLDKEMNCWTSIHPLTHRSRTLIETGSTSRSGSEGGPNDKDGKGSHKKRRRISFERGDEWTSTRSDPHPSLWPFPSVEGKISTLTLQCMSDT